MNHFSKATLKALAKKGITVTGLQGIPGPHGGSTAYVLNDNGTGRVRTFSQVVALAGDDTIDARLSRYVPLTPAENEVVVSGLRDRA